jgi:hypothetical protein
MNYFKGIEYPCYLSEYTITSLFRHIPHNVLQDISLELGLDIKLLTMKLQKTLVRRST